MFIFKAGSADISIYVKLSDSGTGLAKTGLAWNSAGASAYYTRAGAAAAAIVLGNLVAADSAHSDGGFKEVDGTNAKGLYRLDLPDAAVAAGVDFVVVSVEFDNTVEESVLVNLSPDVNVASLDSDTITSTVLAANAIDEIWDDTLEGGLTVRQALRLFLSVLANKSAGGGTATVTFRDYGDTKNRISATVDANGNRSAVVVDGA